MSFGASATELGLASYYGAAGLIAAHRSLPMGSRVKVLNLDNGRSVILRIMDRGPFIRGRVIDVSTAAAEALGFRPRPSDRCRPAELIRLPLPPRDWIGLTVFDDDLDWILAARIRDPILHRLARAAENEIVRLRHRSQGAGFGTNVTNSDRPVRSACDREWSDAEHGGSC